MEMDFLEFSVRLIKTAFEACLSWFSLIMDRTGMLPFYFAGVFIVFVGGFLLSRFGSFVGPGSDMAAKMAERKEFDPRYRKVFDTSTVSRQRALPGPQRLGSGRKASARISRKG